MKLMPILKNQATKPADAMAMTDESMAAAIAQACDPNSDLRKRVAEDDAKMKEVKDAVAAMLAKDPGFWKR